MESSSSEDGGSFDETAQIDLQVLSVEPAKAGRLEALAVVSMTLDGVPVELHGVRVVRQPMARSG